MKVFLFFFFFFSAFSSVDKLLISCLLLFIFKRFSLAASVKLAFSTNYDWLSKYGFSPRLIFFNYVISFEGRRGKIVISLKIGKISDFSSLTIEILTAQQVFFEWSIFLSSFFSINTLLFHLKSAKFATNWWNLNFYLPLIFLNLWFFGQIHCSEAW